MRFFTPELYARFNSAKRDEADKADEQWESAIRGYRKHLDRIRERLAPEVRELADLCLHDAELLSPDQSLQPLVSVRLESVGPEALWRAISVMPLKQDRELMTLVYVLFDRIRHRPPPRGWRFSKLRPHWLYDEIDLDALQAGHFLHRVLLSDGRTLEIPFISAVVRRVSLFTATGGEMARKGA